MSKFEVQLDNGLDLRVIRINEPCTFADMIEFLGAELANGHTRNLIWDFTAGSLQLLDVKDVKGLRTARTSAMGPRAQGHTVLVAYDTAERLFLKWYKKYAEGLPDRTVDYHLANTFDEAMAIVRENYKPS